MADYVDGKYQFTNATLYVPIGTKALYEATEGWNKFQNIVEIEPVVEPKLAGDVNEDEKVNGTDYVALANIILGMAAGSRRMAGGQEAAPAKLSVENFDISAGETKELVISLTNPDDEITLVQFDLRLPEGLSIKETGGEYAIDIAGRTTWRKHSLDANATDGITRFLLASSSNATLSGTSGAVISITLVANDLYQGGDVKLENILLVTPEEKEIWAIFLP